MADVKLRVRDGKGGEALGAFRVEVQTSTPPLARDDEYVVQVGQSITIDAPGVLANDSALGGRPLTARKTGEPLLGSVSAFGANGGFTYTAPATEPRLPFLLTGRILTSDPNVGEDLLEWSPLGDLNRDGKPDLITQRFNGFRAIATRGGDGARLWGVNPPCAIQPSDSPTSLLADIDDDGRLEYVHVTRCGEGGNRFSTYARVQALADDGSVQWTSPLVTSPVTYIPCDGNGICSSTPVGIEWTDALRDVMLTTARLGASAAPSLMYRQYVPQAAALAYGRKPDGTVGYLNFGCQAMTGDAAASAGRIGRIRRMAACRRPNSPSSRSLAGSPGSPNGRFR
jgi:hypothetical protein